MRVINTSYAQLTLSALAHASTTVVPGLLTYMFLYPLPEAAFAPTVMKRRAALDTVWSGIFGRLWDHIGLADCEGYRQAGPGTSRPLLWFRPTNDSSTFAVTTEMASDLNHWNWVQRMRREQINCFDDSLTLPNSDAFLEPYRHFHTTLNITWHVDGDAGSVFEDIFSGGSLLAATGAVVVSLNGSANQFTYPLAGGGDHDGTGVPCRDVFWTLPDGQDAVRDPAAAGYLGTQIGRDLCAYLGFVVAPYLDAYPFRIDAQTGANLLTFTATIRALLTRYHQIAHATVHA